MSLTAIVMAAGASERMGRPKLLLPFGDGTILDATIASVRTTPVDRVIVVTGADADAVEESIADTAVSIVRNPDHRRGNMSSLLVAADADPSAGAYLQVPGDMPTISPSAITAASEAWTRRGAWAAVTAYRDRIAHPFLLSRPALAEAARRPGSKVLWRMLVQSMDPRVERIRIQADAPLDINTPSDHERLLAGD